MLKDNFYTITNLKEEQNIVHATIVLNQQHEIFKGHFPNRPIVPGVCWMQIAKEILACSLNKKLQIIKAVDIKFLQAINPHETPSLKIKIDYSVENAELINANIAFFKEESTCCKIRYSLYLSE